MASIKLKGDTSGEVTIQAPSVAGTTTLNLPVTSSTLATQNALGVRNLIINGDMRIDQRNNGSAVTTTNTFVTDRWKQDQVGGGVISFQRSTESPDDFNYSLSATVTTADATPSYYRIAQKIEGSNVIHLNCGTSSAQTITLSFWVRSSITGTYCIGLQNSAFNRGYSSEYTINSANTWERKTITATCDTTGTWLIDNGIGLTVYFDLGSSASYNLTPDTWTSANAWKTSNQTAWIGTSGATFYITGIQLEVGTEATPFEQRPYDMELARCQRYFQRHYDPALRGVYNGVTSGGASRMGFLIPVSMRATPVATTTGTFSFWNGATTTSATTTNGIFTSTSSVEFDFNIGAASTQGQACIAYTSNSTTKWIDLNSEL